MTSCLVHNVIRGLQSIDHLCINPIRRIGLIHKRSIDSRQHSGAYKSMFYLTIVNKHFVTATPGWHDSRLLRDFKSAGPRDIGTFAMLPANDLDPRL